MIRLALVGCSHVRYYERLAVRCAFATVDGSSLDLEDCEAAFIESSLEDRTDLAIQAAEAGKHVLVALPIARTLEDADRLIEACRAAGVYLMVGTTKRFLPAVKAVRQSLLEGKLGELGLVRIHRWEAAPDSGDSSGGLPAGTVTQEIDLVRWLFGSLPTTLHAAERELGGGRYVQVHCGFAGGGMALIDFTPSLPGARGYYSLTAIGSTGAAYADDHHNAHLLFEGGEPTALISDQESAGLEGLIAEFAAAISERREPAITGSDGRQQLEISMGIQRSLADGCPVTRAGGRYDPLR